MMDTKLKKRIQYSIFNLLLVACIGVLMRYKMGFQFPYFDQKNLQHAHSHFAFYGWIGHTLMSLMVYFLEKKESINSSYYSKLISANLLISYGMLISFAIGGYNAVSIFFSTGAIINSYLFTVKYIKDSRSTSTNDASAKWFIAALIFNVIASIGTFTLAFMMATKHIPQHLYLASVYFFLHFQYNGWFFFACMGLLQLFLQTKTNRTILTDKIFWIFALSCFPAYLLSALWMQLPNWLYVIVVGASIGQFAAWLMTVSQTKKAWNEIKQHLDPNILKLVFILVLALSIKFLLQLGSVIPFVSKLAFGFRPIVIAYLHLVLLAIISLFLLVFIIQQKLIKITRTSITGLILLTSGIYLTELALAAQGIAAFKYIMIPFTNEVLFGFACCMLTGILLIFISHTRKSKA